MTFRPLILAALFLCASVHADEGVAKRNIRSSPSPRPHRKPSQPYKPKATPRPTPPLKGIRVTSFEKGSIFDSLGMKTGDKVVSVNGKKIQTTGDFQRAFSNLKAPCQVEVARGIRPLILRCPKK